MLTFPWLSRSGSHVLIERVGVDLAVAAAVEAPAVDVGGGRAVAGGGRAVADVAEEQVKHLATDRKE